MCRNAPQAGALDKVSHGENGDEKRSTVEWTPWLVNGAADRGHKAVLPQSEMPSVTLNARASLFCDFSCDHGTSLPSSGDSRKNDLPHWILSARLHRNLPLKLLELLPRSPSRGNPYYPHLWPLTALSSDQAKETVRIWVFSSDLRQVEPCFLGFLTLNYSWLSESIWLWSRPVAKHYCVDAASERSQSLSLGGDFKLQIPPMLEDFGVDRRQEPGVFLMWSLISYQSTPDRSWLLSREDAEKIPKWRNPAITRKE